MSEHLPGTDALVQLDERVARLGATLAELGWDKALHQLVLQIPDARERLRYVGQMTESAAHNVLNMVDATQPACQANAREQGSLAERLTALYHAPDLSVAAARGALADAIAQLRAGEQLAAEMARTLTSIMLAQDFQDLSGQVIKKVVDIISHTEEQIQRLLAQSEGQSGAPAAAPALDGPQVPEKAVGQADVDDLLASMGF
mgnify:FL=1